MRHRDLPTDTRFALAGIGLLRDLGRNALARLARDSDLLDLRAGTVIDRAASRARQFVGIVEGYVRATTPDGHELVLGPGDHVGAAELLDDRPHTMNHTCQTNVTVVVTFGPAFRAVAVAAPALTAAARVDAARRLQAASRPAALLLTR